MYCFAPDRIRVGRQRFYLLTSQQQYFNINEERPESKLSHQDVIFAKSMQKNISVKLPLLYIAGVVIYEATPLIKDKTSADNYFTDHADTMALALPIASPQDLEYGDSLCC